MGKDSKESKKRKPKTVEPLEDDVFTAECIVAEREVLVKKKGQKRGRPIRQYYIKWNGYSDAYNTWEPEKNLLDPSILAEWRELNPLPEKGQKRSQPPISDDKDDNEEVKKMVKIEATGSAKAKKSKKLKKTKSADDYDSNLNLPTSLEMFNNVDILVTVAGNDETITFKEFKMNKKAWYHVHKVKTHEDEP